MTQHFLLSSKARTLSLAKVLRLSDDEAFETFKLFPIVVHDAGPLMDAAWMWARTVNAPRLYDMFYLALAEKEQCDLWTADRRFVRLVGSRSNYCRWVGDLEIDIDGQPA